MADPVDQHIENLSSCQTPRRLEAAKELAMMGGDAAPAALALLDALEDDSEEVAEYANAALEELGPPPAKLLPGLVSRLFTDNPDINYWAATLLGRLGGEAVDTVADLCRLVEENPEKQVRQQAVWALGKIGSPEARPTLEVARNSEDPRLSRLAEQALEDTVPSSPEESGEEE